MRFVAAQATRAAGGRASWQERSLVESEFSTPLAVQREQVVVVGRQRQGGAQHTLEEQRVRTRVVERGAAHDQVVVHDEAQGESQPEQVIVKVQVERAVGEAIG